MKIMKIKKNQQNHIFDDDDGWNTVGTNDDVVQHQHLDLGNIIFYLYIQLFYIYFIMFFYYYYTYFIVL